MRIAGKRLSVSERLRTIKQYRVEIIMLLRSSKRIAVMSLGLVAMAAAAGFGQETTFRWKFEPGLKLKSEVTQEVEQGLPNSPMPVTQSFELTQIWEVISVAPDSTARMRTTLTRALMKMNIPGAGAIDLDTDKPADQDSGLAAQIGKMFRPMVNQACENDMAPNGKVSNVMIPEEAMAGFKNLPLGESMSSVLTDSIEKGSPVFPDQAIAPGHSWTQQHSTKNLSAVNQYTYTGPKKVDGRTLHHFDLSIQVEFTGDNPLQAQIEIPEQSAKGTLLFDNDQGYVVASDLDQTMKMVIKIAGQNGIESTTVQKMKTVFTPISSSQDK